MDQPTPPARRSGVIAVVMESDRLLVIRRSQHVIAPGALCFPGGGIEPGESESEALVREIQEELGTVLEPVRRLWWNMTRWNVDLAWWLGRLTSRDQIRPNPAEVESIHWMTAAELLDKPDLLDSNRDFLAALASGEIAVPELRV